MRRSQVKKGSIGEQKMKYGHQPDRRRQFSGCPYRGLMAEGWKAFHAGKPNPYTSRPTLGGKAWAWYQGYTKAKLAKEQGKKSL